MILHDPYIHGALSHTQLTNRGGSRTAATPKMERFVIIVNSFQPLTIITKHTILDVAAVLYPSLYKNITVNCSQRQKKKCHSRYLYELLPFTEEREPPLPVYVGVNIHATARNKKTIENYEQLGIRITYDLVLQAEHLLKRNLCEQFKEDNIACQPQLRKEIFAVGATDNLDHNPFSTAGQGSFHDTAETTIQHPAIENPGEIRPIQFSTKPSLKEADLTEYYSIIAATTNKKATVKIASMKNETDQATQDKITPKHSAIVKEIKWLLNAYF